MFIGKEKWGQLLDALEKIAKRMDFLISGTIESDENGTLGVEEEALSNGKLLRGGSNNSRNMVTIKTDSDGSSPSEQVVDLSSIRDYIYFENGTFKGHTQSGNNIAFYGETAKKLHKLLSDTTYGRIGYEIDLRKKEVTEGGERNLDPDFSPDHDNWN